jgi:hypothetical protein
MNSACYNPCPDGTFINSTNASCDLCNSTCASCNQSSNNCTNCATNYFLFISTCISSCPNGYYTDYTNNTCIACDPTCLLCVSASNCSSCIFSNFYMPYNNTCPSVCPDGFATNTITKICVDCSQNGQCVDLNISIKLQDSDNLTSPIYIDMNFSQNINFTTFPYTKFQTLSFSNKSLSTNIFNISYNITSSKSYRIILTTNQLAFHCAQLLKVKTIDRNQSYFSISNNIFMDSNFMKEAKLSWTYISIPGLSQSESKFVKAQASTMSSIGSSLSQPFWQ